MAERKRRFVDRYKLGAELSKQLDPVCTLEEVGQELGVSKQNAYHESVLALGTLGLLLQQRFGVGRG